MRDTCPLQQHDVVRDSNARLHEKKPPEGGQGGSNAP